MKVPLSWLRDYVDLSLPVAQLAERLTLAGLEVSGVRLIGVPPPEGLRVKGEDAGPVWDRDKILIGQIIDVIRHPDADPFLPAQNRTNIELRACLDQRIARVTGKKFGAFAF